MKFKSTRDMQGSSPALNFSEAILEGLAPDGGLYVPETFPVFDIDHFGADVSLIQVAEKILGEFVDPSLKQVISQICHRAFNFPIRLESLEDATSILEPYSILELYEGPTAAFKDVGARFISECVGSLGGHGSRTVIVATSGDTGGAVAAAFREKPGINVVILYPKGMVSEFQEKQLTCWGENIRAYKVRGTFDDCQRMVKEAFSNPDWKKKNLLSANSINIGRILPQSVYYAWSSLKFFYNTGREPGFIVPSGNLGNALAAIWAKKMGFPIDQIVMACNSNRAVVNYFKTGKWEPQATTTTLANAMDVGNASNMERLLHLYPKIEELRKVAQAFSVSDEEIRSAIRDGERRWKRALCPHTACASFVRHKIPGTDWIIVATAHPAKFRSVVEPLIGRTIDTPSSLEWIEKQNGASMEIDAKLASLPQA